MSDRQIQRLLFLIGLLVMAISVIVINVVSDPGESDFKPQAEHFGAH